MASYCGRFNLVCSTTNSCEYFLAERNSFKRSAINTANVESRLLGCPFFTETKFGQLANFYTCINASVEMFLYICTKQSYLLSRIYHKENGAETMIGRSVYLFLFSTADFICHRCTTDFYFSPFGYFIPLKKSSSVISYNLQNFDMDVNVGNFALRS